MPRLLSVSLLATDTRTIIRSHIFANVFLQNWKDCSYRLRGLKAAQGEWDLVCMAWNLKRMYALRG